MARRQTRRSITIALEDYQGLGALAGEHDMPLSQLATQAIRALLAGLVPLAPRVDSVRLGLDTRAMRARPTPAARPGTCATCGRPGQVTPTQLDPGGPEYPICERCNTEPVPDVPRGRAARRSE